MPMVEFLVATITSQHPRMNALPAKQRLFVTPMTGTAPLSCPSQLNDLMKL